MHVSSRYQIKYLLRSIVSSFLLEYAVSLGEYVVFQHAAFQVARSQSVSALALQEGLAVKAAVCLRRVVVEAAFIKKTIGKL